MLPAMSLLLRWLHVVAAITWIGGMLFVALVLVPVTRREDPALRALPFRMPREARQR